MILASSATNFNLNLSSYSFIFMNMYVYDISLYFKFLSMISFFPTFQCVALVCVLLLYWRGTENILFEQYEVPHDLV